LTLKSVDSIEIDSSSYLGTKAGAENSAHLFNLGAVHGDDTDAKVKVDM
jgi:hypothetical protein